MGPFRETVERGLSALRRPIVWWSTGVVAFVVVNLAFWPSLENSAALQSFSNMDQLLEAFGAQNIAKPAGYVDGQLYALLVPLLFSAMAITVVSGLTAGDESAGRLELLHALPISRRAVWLGRFLASMLMVVVVAAIAGAATVACLPIFSLTEVPVGRIVGATIGCALLAAFHGSIVYAAAGAGASRGLAAGIGILVLVIGYLTSFVLPIAKSLAGARRWSPWYWSLGDQPVTNGVHVGWMLLVVALTALLVAFGTEAVDRRDIRTA
jgi:ABC-2 type transport system permease protein